MGKSKQLAINMIANVVNLAATLAISFFLSPIIVAKLGTESYGFVTLSNNFVNYISLIVIALNSVSGRFITIKIHQKDYKAANIYYNSVLVANVFFSLVLVIPSVLLVYNLEHVVNISSTMVLDVKILFALVFISFYVSIIGNVYSVSTYAKNRLELAAARNTLLNIFRAVVLIGIFSLFTPSIIWVGVVSLAVSILTVVTNISFSRRLLPELKLNIKEFRLSAVKELASSGVWNTISQVGQILLSGLDLLLTNIFISPSLMGVLSIAKTIPDLLGTVANALVSAFAPSFTALYAQNRIDELLKEIKQSTKIVSLLFGIPFGGWLIFGQNFFELWMPTQDSSLLYRLSVITSLGLFVNGGVSCIYNVFTVTNKLRINSISLVCSGILNTLIVLLALKYTNLGIYAVAGVSVIILILRNLIITIPYAAKGCLGQKWYYFYSDVLQTVLGTLAVCIVGIAVKKIIYVHSWFTLILAAGVVGSISLIIEYCLFLNTAEKTAVKRVLKKVRIGGR